MTDPIVSQEMLARGIAAWSFDPRFEDVDAALVRTLAAMGLTVEGQSEPQDGSLAPAADTTTKADDAIALAIVAEDGATVSIEGSAVTICNNATGRVAMTYDAGSVDESIAFAVEAHPPGSPLRETTGEA